MLLALSPAAVLAACSDPDSAKGPERDPASEEPSDGGGDGRTAEATGPHSPSPSGEPPSRAQSVLARLGDREVAAQLVLVGLTAGATVRTATLTDHPVGGYFLLGTWRSAVTVDEVVARVREHSRPGVPPLLAVDQEGGQVRVLRGDAARGTPSASALGEQGPEAVAEAYQQIGEDLAARGIHVDLAPVADVVDPHLGEANGPVGALHRGFGTDPLAVGRCVARAVEALESSGISATLKHFPGLGRVEQNTDFSADGIIDAVTGPGDPTFSAFAAGIDAGAELVMLSSAVYPLLEEGVPAMFSRRIVHDLLRTEMGFTGLIITDDVGAAEAVADIPVPDRATRLLEAGGDAVLTADPQLAGALVDAIAAWAAASESNRRRIRESAARVLAVKEKHGLLED